MNIVKKLTQSHLRENKGRTVVTTLGICVSVAMITAVFVAVASFMNLYGELSILSGGNWHIQFSVTETQLNELKNDDRLESVGVSPNLENSSFLLQNADSAYNGTGDFYSGDSVLLEQMITGEYDGAIPQNENEIAVEESFIEKNNLDWQIGDTVEITTGYRYIIEDGVTICIGGSYISGEKFEAGETVQYKITAILHGNPVTSASYSVICGFDSKNLQLDSGETVEVTARLKEMNMNARDTVLAITGDYSITSYALNNGVFDANFSFNEDSSIVNSIIPMALIILGIIMIASVVLIYNSFAMSLSERVRYLGMLSSVGATRRQKKASVYFEGAILGAVGIPVGLIAGIAGIGITLKAVGKEIVATGLITGVSDSGMGMDVVVPWWAIAGIVLFSALTIFISSFIPAQKAQRVTPIDAIRATNEIKVKAKRLKVPKIVRAVFGYEGELAHKNLKRNGRKSRVITASIALSVVLFLSVNYFCQLLIQSYNTEMDIPYQLYVGLDYDDKDEFIEKALAIDGVDAIYGVDNLAESGELKTIFEDEAYLTNTYKSLYKTTVWVYINIIEDEAFNALCTANGIDYNEYYTPSLKAVLMNNISHTGGGADVFTDKILGTQYDMNDGVEISAFVKYDSQNYVCNLNPKNCISLYLPVSAYHSSISEIEDVVAFRYPLGIETEEHERVADEIYELARQENYSDVYVSDYVVMLKSTSTFVFVMEVFVYGFIALITMITIANIINTISTGIALRRREFAMMKSVGITPRGFKKMIVLESAIYGMRALIFALPVSVIISWLLNEMLGAGTIPFELNPVTYLAVILTVFAIVGFSMLYSVSKIQKDNIIETLKEDIT